jgi:acetolactate synthase I/III small subunit
MSSSTERKNIHTISMMVANKPGVLVRIAHVFARRGYNIDSLVVSPAYNPRFSRMTISAQGDPQILDQIIKQAEKLIDVIHISEHTGTDSVHSELALFKVKYTESTKAIIMKLIKRFQTHVLDESARTLIIEQFGTTSQLDELEILLKKYGVLEMVRTGKVVMAKGHSET